jgi:predicted transposase YbfD/YdcC
MTLLDTSVDVAPAVAAVGSGSEPTPPLTWFEAFADLPDPCVARTRRHELLDLLFIALCAVVSGADSFTEMEEWGQAQEAWLRRRLALPHGIPSHDTFNRLFARLDPAAFSACFLRWVAALRLPPHRLSPDGKPRPEVIALDGKTLRHSFDRAAEQGPLHLVSAWATEQQLVLGQIPVAEKGNEITALPALLELLDLQDCLVTIDAMGCQREIARRIVAQGGDYVLALKANQPTLFEDVRVFLEEQVGSAGDGEALRTFDAEHGRQETRYYWVTGQVAWLKERHGPEAWANLQSIGVVESRRRAGGPGTPVSVERRYYISSLPADARLFARAVRAHWGIENRVHWVLDLAFREDESRVRRDHAPANLATLRHLALNLLRRDHTVKRGIKTRRLRAGWDPLYLERLLTN